MFPMESEKIEFFEEGSEAIREECHRVLAELTDSLLKNQEHIIGQGNVAEVHSHPENTNLCLKVISDKTINKILGQSYCSLEDEARFLDEASKIKGNVKVPRPYISVVLRQENMPDDAGLQVLIMERLKAVSLRNILEDEAEFPADFDLDIFFAKLQKFVERMNEELHIYHRDLHAGNIMVDEEGSPYVIDFGSATKAFSEEDSWPTNLQGQRRRIPSDSAQLKTTEKDTRRKLLTKL